MMRKRASKRRWIKRCKLGRLIPLTAIAEHRLDKRFDFEGEECFEFYRVVNEAKRPDGGTELRKET